MSEQSEATNGDISEVEIMRHKPGAELERLPEGVSIGAVVGATVREGVYAVTQAAIEYKRMVQENAELRGCIAVLKTENEWLRSMVNKVVK